MIRRSHILFIFQFTLCTIGFAVPDVPIQITNLGEIKIDQDDEFILFDQYVEVHQTPYLLRADQLRWDRGTSLLLATGDVRLLISPDEAEKSSTHPLLLSNQIDSNGLVEILQASELRFDTSSQTVLPSGRANIQLGSSRVVGEDFEMALNENAISTGNYRVGFGDFFMEGDSLNARDGNMIAKDAHFFIGEPEALSFQGHAREIEKRGEDTAILRGVRFQLGAVPFFYWPYYKHNLRRQVFSISGGAGYSGDVGAYVELRPTYQPKDHTKFFTEFNTYSERGVLIGPGFDLSANFPSGNSISTKLETGFIYDNGNLGVDILDRPIDADRHYLDFEYIQHYRSNFQVLGKIQHWSDSEVLRDFQSGMFHSIQQPQSFLEINSIFGPLAISLASHIRHEDFEFATERTPEFNLQLLPTPIGKSGLHHSLLLGGVKLRNSNPNNAIDLEHNRFRAYYQLLYPIAITPWLDFVPQTTYQHLQYSISDPKSEEYNSNHWEVGFDLNMFSYGEWNLNSKVWDIAGIRHILKPTFQYRYVENRTNEDDTMHPLPIEARVFRTGVDDIDLTANTHLDDLMGQSIFRVGILNDFVVRSQKGEIRELVDLDLYHDLYIPNDSSLASESMFAANVQLKPAYWLNLNLQSRFDSKSLELSDLFARLQLIDGDIWDAEVAAQFIRDDLHQYIFDFRYKLFENLRFVSSLGFDARKTRLYEQVYGVQIGLANYWDLYLSVRMRKGSRRNDDTRLELKIKAARF